jgi:hypothetical protein
MTTAIGVVITEHIVTGRLEDQHLTSELLRYPTSTEELDTLAAMPASDLVEILAGQIATVAGDATAPPVDAIGVAVPGIIRHGVVEG